MLSSFGRMIQFFNFGVAWQRETERERVEHIDQEELISNSHGRGESSQTLGSCCHPAIQCSHTLNGVTYIDWYVCFLI